MAYTNEINNVPSSIRETYPRDFTFKDVCSQLNVHRDGKKQDVKYFGAEAHGFASRNPKLVAQLMMIACAMDYDKSSIIDTNNVSIHGTAIWDVVWRFGCLSSNNPEVEKQYPIHLIMPLYIFERPIIGEIIGYTRVEPIEAMQEGTIYSRTGQLGGWTKSYVYSLSRYVLSSYIESILSSFGNPKQLAFQIEMAKKKRQEKIQAQRVKLCHYALCGGIPLHHEEHVNEMRLSNHRQFNAKYYLKNCLNTFLWAHDKERSRQTIDYMVESIRRSSKTNNGFNNYCAKNNYIVCGRHTLKLFDEHFGSAKTMKPTAEWSVTAYGGALFQKNERDVFMFQDVDRIVDTPKDKIGRSIMAIEWNQDTNIISLNDNYTTKTSIIDHPDNPEYFKSLVVTNLQVGVLREGSEFASQNAHANVNLYNTEYYSPSEDRGLVINEWDCNLLYSVQKQFDMHINRQTVSNLLMGNNKKLIDGIHSEKGFLQKVLSINYKQRQSSPLYFVLNNPKARPFLVKSPNKQQPLPLHYKLNRVVGDANNANHPPEMLHAITRSYLKAHSISGSMNDNECKEYFESIIASHSSIDSYAHAKKDIFIMWKMIYKLLSFTEQQVQEQRAYFNNFKNKFEYLYNRFNFGWTLCSPQLFWAVISIGQIEDFFNYLSNEKNCMMKRDFNLLQRVGQAFSQIRMSLQMQDNKAVNDKISKMATGVRTKPDVGSQYHLYSSVLNNINSETYKSVHFPHHYMCTKLKEYNADILFMEMIILPTFTNKVYLGVCGGDDTPHVVPMKPCIYPVSNDKNHPSTCSFTADVENSKDGTTAWNYIYGQKQTSGVSTNVIHKLPYTSQICQINYIRKTKENNNYMVFYCQSGLDNENVSTSFYIDDTFDTPASGSSTTTTSSSTTTTTTKKASKKNFVLHDITSVIPGIRTPTTRMAFNEEKRPDSLLEYSNHNIHNDIVYPLDQNSFHLSPHYDIKVEYLRGVGTSGNKNIGRFEKMFAHYLCLYKNTELTWSVPRKFKFWFGYNCYAVGMGSFEMGFGYKNQSIWSFVGATTTNTESSAHTNAVHPSIPMGMIPNNSDACAFSTIASNVKTEFITDNVFTNVEAEHGPKQNIDRLNLEENLTKARFGARRYANIIGRVLPVPTCSFRSAETESFDENYVHVLGRAGPFFDKSCHASGTYTRSVSDSTPYLYRDLSLHDPTTTDNVHLTCSYSFLTGCAHMMYGDQEPLECWMWCQPTDDDNLHKAEELFLDGNISINTVHTDPARVMSIIKSSYYILNHTCGLKLDHTVDVTAYKSNRISTQPSIGGKSTQDTSGARTIDADTAKLVTNFVGSVLPSKYPFRERHSYVSGTQPILHPLANA